MKIYKSKNGSYYIRPYIFVNGIKKQTTYHFATKEAAMEKILELKKGIYTAKKTIQSDYSFEYAYLDFMLEQERRLKPTTYYSYRKSADKHLIQHFRNKAVHQIDRQEINAAIAYINKLKTTARHKNRLLNVMKSFFRHCIVNFKTDHFWVDNIEPFREKVAKKRDNRKKYYTVEDLNQFLTGVTNQLEKTFFTVLFYSGLRMGEIRALTWTDWNSKKMCLEVNKQLSAKTFSGQKLFIPKTHNSIRTVFIPEKANDSLKKLKLIADKRSDYIFNVSESQIHRWNRRISDAAEIERIKIHEFRHSYATLMVKNGMNPNILQKQLGHSDIKVTLRYYVHFELDDQSKEVDRIFNKSDFS
jgi:integrase